jgi:hypothetical protein
MVYVVPTTAIKVRLGTVVDARHKRGPEKRRLALLSDAATYLLSSDKAAKCPLCNLVFYRGQETYNFLSPIIINSADSRKLVRHGRKHCLEEHDGSWLWNFVSDPCQTSPHKTIEDKLDTLVCLALGQGAKLFPLDPQRSCSLYTNHELVELFNCRVIAAIAWLKWNFPRRTGLRQIFGACQEEADIRLRLLQRNTKHVKKALRNERPADMINLVQLIFVDRSVHKRFLS